MAKKVIWAFDPYEKSNKSWSSTLKFLELARFNEWANVTPCFLLGHQLVHWIANVTPSQLTALLPVTKKVLDEKIKSLEGTFLKEPKVVVSKGHSAREDIAVFADFLESEGADLVVLNTHSKQALERFFMGSFTENLLLKTNVPALIIPPNMRLDSNFDKIMFPVSFSIQEFDFFKKFMEGPLKANVILCSKVFHPIDAFAQSATYALGGGWVSVEAFAQDAIAQRKEAAAKWERFARGLGVEVEIQIDDEPGDLAEWVVGLGRDKSADMIVMPSFATKSEAVFLGSNAREIIRHSDIPVYVQRMQG